MQPHHPAEWFRHGDTTDAANIYRALAAAPTLVTDGIAIPGNLRDELATVDIQSNAAGAHSAVIIIWGYKPTCGIHLAGVYTPIVDATRGPGWSKIGQVTITATGANERTGHQLQGVSSYSRVAAQVTTAVGAPSFWIDFGFSAHKE